MANTERRAAWGSGGWARLGLGYRRWALRRRTTSTEAVLAIVGRQLRRARYCLVITESDGRVTARVVEPFRPSRDGTIRFGTDPASRKARDVQRSGRCLLVYQDDRRRSYVTLECAASLQDEPTGGRPRFKPSWTAFWPHGPVAEDYVVVACTPVAIELWHGTAVVAPDPFGRRALRLEQIDGAWREAPTA